MTDAFILRLLKSVFGIGGYDRLKTGVIMKGSGVEAQQLLQNVDFFKQVKYNGNVNFCKTMSEILMRRKCWLCLRDGEEVYLRGY